MRKNLKVKKIDALDCEWEQLDEDLIGHESTVVEEVDNSFLYEELNRQIDTLNERESKVVRLRFGEEFTLKAIGTQFCVSSERIRCIGAKGLRKMRHRTRGSVLQCMIFHRTQAEEDYYQDELKKVIAEREAREHKLYTKKLEERQRLRCIAHREARAKHIEALSRKRELDKKYEQRRQARIRELNIKVCLQSHEALIKHNKMGHAKEIERQEERNNQYRYNIKKIIEEEERINVEQYRFRALEEIEARRKHEKQKYLLKQLETHGKDYDEDDIPYPPSYINIERDSSGKPYLAVPQIKYFEVSDEIYQYWLALLLLEEKNQSDLK